jgi:hypothetical protein
MTRVAREPMQLSSKVSNDQRRSGDRFGSEPIARSRQDHSGPDGPSCCVSSPRPHRRAMGSDWALPAQAGAPHRRPGAPMAGESYGAQRRLVDPPDRRPMGRSLTVISEPASLSISSSDRIDDALPVSSRERDLRRMWQTAGENAEPRGRLRVAWSTTHSPPRRLPPMSTRTPARQSTVEARQARTGACPARGTSELRR